MLDNNVARALDSASKITREGQVLAAVWNHTAKKKMGRLRKDNRLGYIYLARVGHEKFKVGWSKNPTGKKGRGKEAGTWGNDFEILRTHRAKRKWEPQVRYVTKEARVTILQAMTQWDYEVRKAHKGHEVFIYAGNVTQLIERFDSLFRKAYPRIEE